MAGFATAILPGQEALFTLPPRHPLYPIGGSRLNTQVPRRPVCSVSAGIRKRLKLRWRPALAQSGEHVHGRKIWRLFSSSVDQQEQPFVQVNADRSIWIK